MYVSQRRAVTSGSWNVIAKHFVPKIDARPDVTVGWVKKTAGMQLLGVGGCFPPFVSPRRCLNSGRYVL